MAVDLQRHPSMIGPVTPRKWTGRPVGRPKGSRGEARVLLTVRVRPDQDKALRDLAAAETKAREERTGRAAVQLDLSAVLRRLLDKALGLKPPKPE